MFPETKDLQSTPVLIHAPYGRDAELIQNELCTARFSCTVCASLEELCLLIEQGTGVVLIADEALPLPAVARLSAQLSNQPR